MTPGKNRESISFTITAVFIFAGFFFANIQVAFAGKSTAGFCQRPTLRDYESGLEGLPTIEQFPSSGRLPFAPEGVMLDRSALPPNTKRVIVGGGSFGYLMHGPIQGADVEWNVTSEVVRLSGSDTLEVIETREAEVRHIGNVATGAFVVKMPVKPGRYRYGMTFRDPDGQTLGAYNEYLAVVRPVNAVELEVEDGASAAGEPIVARLGNRGSLGISVLKRLALERKTGSHWRQVMFPPSRGFAEKELAGAGTTSGCLRVVVPKWSSSGVYRVSAQFEVLRKAARNSKTLRTARATFEVN
jgi:hypothetical protein